MASSAVSGQADAAALAPNCALKSSDIIEFVGNNRAVAVRELCGPALAFLGVLLVLRYP